MLRLVNAGKVTPTNYVIDPTCPDFEPGQIAEIYFYGNTKLCRPYCGGAIVGIIDDIKRGANNSTLGSGRITIWNHHGMYETDQYDSMCGYLRGMNLFVDVQSSKLTTHMKNAQFYPVIAAVIDPPTATNPLLRFEWFLHHVAQSTLINATPGSGIIGGMPVPSNLGPARCKCGYTNEYVDPTQPYECYKCRNNI